MKDAPDAECNWRTGKFAQRALGVSGSTLIKWANSGKIPTRRTAGGHRQYNLKNFPGLTDEQSEREWYTGKFAQKALGVSGSTLIKWANTGKIQTRKTAGGHRQYNLKRYAVSLSPAGKSLNVSVPNGPESSHIKYILYARVSNSNAKDMLNQQRQLLKASAVDHGWPIHQCEILSDIGSGLDYERRSFLLVIDRVLARAVRSVMVTSRDVLCGYCCPLIEYLFRTHNTDLIVLDKGENPYDDELSENVLLDSRRLGSEVIYTNPSYKRKKDLDQRPDDLGHMVDGRMTTANALVGQADHRSPDGRADKRRMKKKP